MDIDDVVEYLRFLRKTFSTPLGVFYLSTSLFLVVVWEAWWCVIVSVLYDSATDYVNNA